MVDGFPQPLPLTDFQGQILDVRSFSSAASNLAAQCSIGALAVMLKSFAKLEQLFGRTMGSVITSQTWVFPPLSCLPPPVMWSLVPKGGVHGQPSKDPKVELFISLGLSPHRLLKRLPRAGKRCVVCVGVCVGGGCSSSFANFDSFSHFYWKFF
eukprot:EG_transcript_184